jgi:HEAT repeat protein
MHRAEKTQHFWQLYRTSEAWEGFAARLIPEVSLNGLQKTIQSDPDPNVRIVAIRLIESLGDKRAIPFLLKFQNDSTINYPTGLQLDENEPAVTVGETARAAIATLRKSATVETSEFEGV